jgi:hypothetical protein
MGYICDFRVNVRACPEGISRTTPPQGSAHHSDFLAEDIRVGGIAVGFDSPAF